MVELTINGAAELSTPCKDCGILCFESSIASKRTREHFGVVVCIECAITRDLLWAKSVHWA